VVRLRLPLTFAGSVSRRKPPPPEGVRPDFWEHVTQGKAPPTAGQRAKASARTSTKGATRPRGRPPGSRNHPTDPNWSATSHPRGAHGRFVNTGRSRQRQTLTPTQRRDRPYRPRNSLHRDLFDVAGDLLGYGSGRSLGRNYPSGSDWKESIAYQWRLGKEFAKLNGNEYRSLHDQAGAYGKFVNASLEQRHTSHRALEKNTLRHVARLDSALSKFKAPGDSVVYAQLPRGAIREGHSIFYPGYLHGTQGRHPKEDQVRIQIRGGDPVAVFPLGGRRVQPSEIPDLARHVIPPEILRLAQSPHYHAVFPRDSYFRIYRAYDNGNNITYYAVRVPHEEALKYAKIPLATRPRDPIRDLYRVNFPWDIPGFPSRQRVHEAARRLERIPFFSDQSPSAEGRALEFRGGNRGLLGGGSFNPSLHPRGRGGQFARSLTTQVLQRTGRALFNPDADSIMARLGFTFGGHITVSHTPVADPDASASPTANRATKRTTVSILKNIFDKVPSRREVARLVGAPDGSHVVVSARRRPGADGYDEASFRIYHPTIQDGLRTVYKDRKTNRKILMNQLLYLQPDVLDRKTHPAPISHEEILQGYRRAGLGTRIFAGQVRQARADGISRILVHANSDNAGGNGAFTWARLGYNGYIPLDHPHLGPTPSFIKERVHAKSGERFTTIHDIMSTREGQRWWKSKTTGGVNFGWVGTFNTSPTSRHSRYLEAYLRHKGISID
jgi:hypothetical protein